MKKDIFCFSNKKFICGKVLSYSENLENKPLYNKKVFLTFDDGPCIKNTKKILNILKDKDVKATFFVVGEKCEENPQLLKAINDYGMSIGIHTYSHNYKKMYKDLNEYLNDLQACNNTIKKIIGRNPIPYIRMPGGSSNLIANKDKLDNIKVTLNQRGLNYVDWNVCVGDAESREVSVEKIKQNIIIQCKNRRTAVVLMHDTYYKYSTAEALPWIIKYLKNEGFEFKTFDNLTLDEEKEMIRLGIINRS